MATLSVSNIQSQRADWTVSGLSSDFNTTNYISAGVSSSSFIDGASSVASVSSVSAPSTGTSRSAGGSASGLTAGTSYTWYGYAQSSNGLYYNAGSVTFTTLARLATPTITIGTVTQTSIAFTVNTVPNGTYDYVDYYNNTTNVYLGTQGGPSPFSSTLTGLSPSTTYRLQYYATSSTGYQDSPIGSTTATTSAPPQLSSPSVTITTIKYRSVIVNASSTNADRYVVEVVTPSNVLVTTITSSSPITVSGLSAGTSYKLRVKAQRSDGTYTDSSFSLYNSFSTLSAPSSPSFDTSKTVKGNSSVTLYWSSVSYADNYELDYRAQGGSTWSIWSSNIGGINATVTGLANGQAYEFQVRAYVGDYGDWTAFSPSVIATPGLRPQNFAWTTTKTAGQAVNLTAAEWNAFTTRINDFRTYKTLGAYVFSLASTNATITASIVNQAINAINAMSPPTVAPSTVSTESLMYASFFNNLVTSLNSIP